MDEMEIMEKVAEWFGVEPNDDGTYDINDYDWQSGCHYKNGKWLTLSEVVYLIESIMEDMEDDD